MTFDLTISDDQRQILDAAKIMLGRNYPQSRLRDSNACDSMTPLVEFGAFVLALPDTQDGAGFSVVEEALLHAAFGRHLVSPSSMAAAIGLRIALATGRDDLANAIGTGEIKVCAGTETGAGMLLFEPDGAAQAILRRADGIRLVDLAEADIIPQTAMGHGRPVARATTPAAVSNNAPAGEDLNLIATLLTCAQLLGVATGARDLAVDYAGIREQFGRPIGSFQAIKHHCANMAIGVDMLSAQLDMAAIALRDRREDAAFQIAALVRLAPKIALSNARLGIQIHGGIGFSAEADAQLYIKHAHVLGALAQGKDLLSLPAPLAPLEEN